MNTELFKDMDLVMNQIVKGAFLTVSDGERLNTMTIGWATIGILWNKPIMIVAVRDSRYTYDLMNKAKDFSVSLPMNTDLAKALSYCGTHSGESEDKFEASGITTCASKNIISPIISECDLFFECKTVYAQFMDPTLLDEKIESTSYPQSDYHKMYYGEILERYAD